MALKSYVVTQDYRSPFVRMTGRPNRPQEVKFKSFRKGDIVNGELKHANNAPAFVLVQGTLVFPLSVVKEVVTKEIVSEVEGGEAKPEAKKISLQSMSKVKYIDAIVVGGLAGFGGVFLAEKQGWIVSPDKKNRIYGAIGGALLGIYLVYRTKNK
jgi:hypothetical protein